MSRLSGIGVKAAKGMPMVCRDSARLIAGVGLEGDCHGGGRRQVSLVAGEALKAIEALEGIGLCLEKYAANLTTVGLNYHNLKPGNRLEIGKAVLELTEAGKPCNDACALFQQNSACPLTTKCAFAVVIEGGEIRIGDFIQTV